MLAIALYNEGRSINQNTHVYWAIIHLYFLATQPNLLKRT